MLTIGRNEQDLLMEAALMAQFDHPNIVALIGVVTKSQPIKVIVQVGRLCVV